MSTSSLPRTADVAIVGGGCVGASIAYHLTRLGIHDIVLLDRSALASGPTGRSSAQLIPRSEHPLVARLKWEGLEFFRNLETEPGRSVDFRSSGYLAVAPRSEADALAADLRELTALGSRAARLDQKDVQSMAAGIAIGEDEAALSIPEAGYVDPTAAVQALTACASGLRVFPFTPASIRFNGGKATAILTEQGEIAAGAVVLACGVWTNELLAPIEAKLPLYWHRAEVCCYRRPKELPAHPIVGDFVHRFYFRPELGELTLAGSIPRMDSGIAKPGNLEDVVHPDRFRESVRTETIQQLFVKLVSRVPLFSRGYWRRGYACVYDVTPDWHPVLSLEGHAERLYAAAGFSGHGFVLSSGIGRIVSEAVAGVEGKPEERRLFRPERFEQNDPVSFKIG